MLSFKLSRTKTTRAWSVEQLQGSFFLRRQPNLSLSFRAYSPRQSELLQHQDIAAKPRWQRLTAVDYGCDKPPNFERPLRNHFKYDLKNKTTSFRGRKDLSKCTFRLKLNPETTTECFFDSIDHHRSKLDYAGGQKVKGNTAISAPI